LANDIADGGRSQEHRGHRDVRLEEAALVRRESLRQDFRLTAAQAGFTREILKADGLQAAADRLGISLTTARTHLAHLFDKTDTRRPAEFVRLILQSQPATHAD